MSACILHEHADASKSLPVVEAVFTAEEVGGCDEILDGGNDRFAIAGSDEVVFNAHELDGFSAGFFCLRDVKIHFVAVEIGVVGIANTLVQAESLPWPDFRL